MFHLINIKFVPSTPRHPPDAICPNNILVCGRMSPPTLGIHSLKTLILYYCNNDMLSEVIGFIIVTTICCQKL